jgi:hypothetical protein
VLDHPAGGSSGPPPAVFPGPAAYPGYAPPPPPSKPSRAGLIASVVSGVVAVLCVGAGTTTFFVVQHLDQPGNSTGRPVALPTVDPTAAPTETPTDASTETPAGPSTKPSNTVVVHHGDLKRLMMGQPAGARKWPDVKTVEALTLTTATADLAQLGMISPDDDGEASLIEDGFTDGYVRRWIDKHDTYVTVRIYRFDHAGGGVEFANNKVGGAEADVWGEARRNIKDDPNAASFVQPKTRRGLQEALVAGGFSDIAILVTTQQRPPAAATVAKSVFSDEHRKL